MGVRIALGATTGDIVSVLVGRAAKLALIGLAAGLGIAFAANHLIRSMLFGVRAQDPVAMGGAVLLLGVSALAAALVPAVRASRVDPLRVFGDR
jgi:ABC-type antimicrobial peptide transport system permease subunit